jgi:hypothetical protein
VTASTAAFEDSSLAHDVVGLHAYQRSKHKGPAEMPGAWASYFLVTAPPATTMFNQCTALDLPVRPRPSGSGGPSVGPIFLGTISFGKILKLCFSPAFWLLGLPLFAWPVATLGYLLPKGPARPPTERLYVNQSFFWLRTVLLNIAFVELYLMMLYPFTQFSLIELFLNRLA